jgi:hypothetical protein
MIGDSRGKKWQRLAGGFGVIGTATWSHDGKYICLDAATQHDSVYLRVRVSDGKVERIASLKNVSRYWGSWGFWSGLAPGDLPLIALDTSRPEVYALDWQLP